MYGCKAVLYPFEKLTLAPLIERNGACLIKWPKCALVSSLDVRCRCFVVCVCAIPHSPALARASTLSVRATWLIHHINFRKGPGRRRALRTRFCSPALLCALDRSAIFLQKVLLYTILPFERGREKAQLLAVCTFYVCTRAHLRSGIAFCRARKQPDSRARSL